MIGSEAELSLLDDAHSGAAFGLAYKILRDTGRAEDAVQDAFVALWKSRQTFDPARASMRTFLLTIVHHKCIDEIRRDGRRNAREQLFHQAASPIAPDGPEQIAERSYDAGILRRTLTELPHTHRTVLELAYFEGLSCREVAARMGIPLGTVKSRMRHGLDKLGARMAHHAPDLREDGRPVRRAQYNVG